VLAVHSGAGFVGYAASDRVPERIAAMVYVDSAPGIGASDPDYDGAEMPMPSLDELRANENLDGLSQEHLETFRRRAVPEPGLVLRQAAELTDDARLDVPSTVICTGFPSEQVRAASGRYAWLAGLAELRTYVDLPPAHWPMVAPPGTRRDHRRGRVYSRHVADLHGPSSTRPPAARRLILREDAQNPTAGRRRTTAPSLA
jgi:pimeloyl-ACP methyl ester carboxylesterase